MTVILLAPLDIFATLQRLGLLPAWTLPHPRAFVPLSPSSPFRMPYLPKGLDIRSLLGFMSSVIISPLALTSIMWWARPLVEKKLRKYIRACLPKPNFPDKYSLLGAEEDGLDHRDIPGLGNAVDTPEYWESMSLLEELSKDLQSIGRNFQFFCNLWRSLVHLKPTRSRFSASNQGADSRILGSRRTTVTGVANQPPIGVDHPQDGVRQIPLPTVRVPSETPASSVPNLPREASSSSPSRPSTPRLPIELTGTNVSSRHVQLNGPFTLPGLATPSQSTLRVQILYDHITTLTTYPANSMASSLATRLTTILLLPLEALFVRSVARAFLSSPAASAGAQAAAMRWKSEVYPLGGWFGSGLQGGWRGMGDYVSKMVLVQGLEMGIQAAVWQVCVGMGWFIGRKWYGWGK